MPVSASRRAANDRWDAANMKRMSLIIPIALYDSLKARADATGQPVNRLIRQAIEAALTDTPTSPGT